MSKYSDQDYLRSQQYKDASKLNTRIELHRRFSTNPQSLYRRVFDLLQIRAGESILELGCGPGDLWQENLDRLHVSCRIHLTDFSPGMLRQAQKNLAQSDFRFDFTNLDAQLIPFGKERFDLVIANFVLYHIPDRSMALSEIQRVLRPGGRLFAATNGQMHLHEIEELIKKIDPGQLQESPIASFNLENGAQILSNFFSQVRLHSFEDSLLVTEVQPLLAYMRSMDYTPEFDRRREDLAQLIQSRIQDEGAFFVRKGVGMFEAVKRK